MSVSNCNKYSENDSLRRGTTPTNTFNVNIDLREATVYVSYAQRGILLVDKTGTDLFITEDQIVTTLSQEDTLKFKPGEVDIQIRYVKADGTADASNIIKTTVDQILKDGEIEYVYLSVFFLFGVFWSPVWVNKFTSC